MNEFKVNCGPLVRRMADIEPESILWLWPGRIPRGKLTVLAGNPGLGKSFLTIDLAARVSRSMPWPDCRGSAPLGSAVLLSAEDDPADTIRPRLDAAGADVSRVYVVEGVQRTDDKGEYITGLELDRDLQHLESAIEEAGDCRLVVIDPISAYLGGVDSHRDAAVRSVLKPLADLAARHGVAVVMVAHLRKGDGEAVQRTMGSLGFVAAARSAWSFSEDREDKGRVLMTPIKLNLAARAKGLAYRMVPVGETAVLAWEPDELDMTAEEAIGRDQKARGEKGKAVRWLRGVLADGAVEAKELQEQAESDGYSWTTIVRAKKGAGVESVKSGFQGRSCWSLAPKNVTAA
ncbi:MAG: AAA family ATPase [Planctomycetales bacterium]